MSLQIWLPLTKDLRQQGLSNITVTNTGVTYSSTGGKLGGCYNFDGTKYLQSNETIGEGVKELTFACWICPGSETLTSGQWYRILGIGPHTRAQLDISSDNRFRLFVGQTGSTSGLGATSTTVLQADVWYHICGVLGNNYMAFYVNGNREVYNTIDSSSITYTNADYFRVGTINSGNLFRGKLNDVRYYNHALSPMEVKELSKGLVLHYPLNRQGWGQENLLIDTTYKKADASIANSSTDWTKYFRRYNGSADIHSILNGEDTIILNSASNLGICFVRKATDINLDSSSYYTLSCEAKSTQTAKQMCIGLSYYNNSNSWVWRGGSNGQSFTTPNKWQKFTLTFKPDADTQYICYCFTVVGVTNGTDTWTIRNCKLEKGSIATPWCPNSSDALAITMGLNSTTEYDCSGFCNNGTRTGTFSWTSDTPKYQVSTIFNSTSIIDTPIIITSTDLIPQYTAAVWIKRNNTSTSGSHCFFTGPIELFIQGSTSHVRFYWSHATSTSSMSNNTWDPSITINNLVWTHIAVTFADGVLKCYINGELSGTSNRSGTGQYIYGTQYHTIGSFHDTTEKFIGDISDVRAYATALSADDVKSLYQNSAYIDSSGNVYGAIHVED